MSNQGKEYWQQEYHWHKQVESDDHRSVMYGLTEEDKQRMNKTKIAKMDMEAFRQMKELEEQLVEFNKRLAIAEFERDRWKSIAMGGPDDAEDYVRRQNVVDQDIAYRAFIERIKNPATKCLMHDDALNAAELIDMWRGVAETLHSAITEGAGGEGIEAFEWGRREEREIINSQSYQGEKRD